MNCNPTKRTSGNGTLAPQWMYICIHIVFFVIPNPFVFKWGIAGKWDKRMTGISDSIPGYVVPVFLVWVPFAYHLEQAGHRVLKFINVKYLGSGKREWFLLPGLIVAIPVMLAAVGLAWGSLLITLSWVLFGEKYALSALKSVLENPSAGAVVLVVANLAVVLWQVIKK